jgi:hypothetical protein
MTALNNKFVYESYHNHDEHSTKEEVDDRSDQPLVNVESPAATAAARSRSNLLKQLDFELPRAYRSFGKIKYLTVYLIIGISDENAQCNQCSATFKSSVQLNTHTILYHYGDRVDLQLLAYECCGKCSRRYATLDRLINEHSINDCSVDERRTRLAARDICVCVFCGAAIVCARLIDHLRSVHADEMCDRKLPINVSHRFCVVDYDYLLVIHLSMVCTTASCLFEHHQFHPSCFCHTSVGVSHSTIGSVEW